MIQQYGGVISDNERVLHVEPGDVVLVRTTRDEYQCKSVVITTGPWASTLLSPLGLTLPLRVMWKNKIITIP